MAPDLVSVTSYGLPVLISMTSLGHTNLISMTNLGLPNLVSVTIGTRIFKKKFKKRDEKIFFKIFTMFIVILRCFYIIYVKMSYQCRVPLRESICSLDVDQMVSVRPQFAMGTYISSCKRILWI